MSSRVHSTATASSMVLSTSSSSIPDSSSRTQKQRHWVEPAALPNYGDVSSIAGNVPDYVKQLNLNTFHSYGVGSEDCFGHKVGKTVKFVEVNVNRNDERQGRLEATTVAEVTVSKYMLNGAGMLHGGCVAYIIDNCCSTPLVVLGLLQNVNGVGVTQGMNVLFHAPAPMYVTSLAWRVRVSDLLPPEQWHTAENNKHIGITWWESDVFTMRDLRHRQRKNGRLCLPKQDAAEFIKALNMILKLAYEHPR